MLETDGPTHINTAAEVERWRGRVEKTLDNLETFAGDIDKSVLVLDEKLDAKVTSLSEAVSTKVDAVKDSLSDLKNTVTKLVVYCSLGMFFGSAVISILVGLAIKWITGK